MQHRKIIAVDFDGTIAENKFPDIGEPIHGFETIALLKSEQEKGARLILWTCRADGRLTAAVEWCKAQGLRFEAVNENLPDIIEAFCGDTRKIFANEYWDDRAVRMPPEKEGKMRKGKTKPKRLTARMDSHTFTGYDSIAIKHPEDREGHYSFMDMAERYPGLLWKCIKKLADCEDAEERAEEAQADRCKHCGYRMHSKEISKLPNCNDCGKAVTCEHKPQLGAWERINCFLHEPVTAKNGNKSGGANIATGDTVKFGPYKWQVLDARDGKALLLLSEPLKKRRRYHGKPEPVTWEKCELREWLNKDWLARKFADGERAAIAETALANSNNPEYGAPGGESTTDKAFLLSIDEYGKYRGVVRNTAFWWRLRSPGYLSYYAAFVNTNGTLLMRGNNVFWSGGGVRPAMWVDLGVLEPIERTEKP